MKAKEVEQQIIKCIHDLGVENQLYGAMFFGEHSIQKTADIIFRIDRPENNDDIKENCEFILDNILSRLFHYNYNENYKSTKNLGNTIHFKDKQYTNDYIIYEYRFISDNNFMNLEDMVLNVIDDGKYLKVYMSVDIPDITTVVEKVED